jgi:DNA-binding CsgD family transcriptional regulator
MNDSSSTPSHLQEIPLSALEMTLGLSLAVAREWHARLTRREAQVAALMAAGKPNPEIARELGIRPSTLAIHRANVKGKFDSSTTAGVANAVNLLRLAEAADGVPPENR